MPLANDVLIVGAGPTGLMLACQLARWSVGVNIIDRHAGPARETRALGVQARTMEIYAQLGIANRALELGKQATGANLWSQGRKTARIPLGEIGLGVTKFPYLFILGQDDNERILGERLNALGVSVRWNTELIGLQQETSHVTATLKPTDGSIEPATFRWVAGCDGARSTVRERSGIGFPGAPYEHVFFVADVEARGNIVPGELNVFLWRQRFHALFPMRGPNHWRLVGIVPRHLRGRDGLGFNDVIPELNTELGMAISFGACRWFSTYRIHHRSAQRFCDRRCFLLGDAAHIHSPVGAQGMNTGLQDAYNLGWKLGLVASGHARDALLDSYDEERGPVARRLLATTDRAFRLVVSEHPLAGLFRTKVMARLAAFAMGHASIRRLAFRSVSQTGIHYRQSSLSATPAHWPEDAPRAGDRFPWLRVKFEDGDDVADLFERLDGLGFNLILIGQKGARQELEKFAAPARILTIADNSINDDVTARAKLPRPSFFLLRPDGHIGLCGARLDGSAIERYLSTRLHLAN